MGAYTRGYPMASRQGATRKKVREGEEFVFVTGATAATIAQARKQLAALSPEQFAHHVNQEKHDIYTWIRDCLDADLAERIRHIRDREELIAALR
jgi:hypothetical protein